MEKYDDCKDCPSWIPGDNGDTDYELEWYLEVGRYEHEELD